MAGTTEARASRLFVILNPKAGSYAADAVSQALGRHLNGADGSCHVHPMTGADQVGALARAAVERGCDAVVAAGGDGTVSAVAGALVGSEAALGIIPLGTANVLARELGIPVDLDGACRLLAGPAATTQIDAMQVGDRYFFTQVGVGLDALMIRDTTTESKRRFGRVAYLWTAFARFMGFQPRRFSIAVGAERVRPRASQVLVANCATLGQPPFTWGPDIRPDDGRVDVCIVRARTAIDYLGVAWHVVRGKHEQSRNVRYLDAEHTIAIHADRPLPVQADGEIIGETPVEIKVAPRAVRVLVPAPRDGPPDRGG